MRIRDKKESQPHLMSFFSLITRSVIQRLNLYYSLFQLFNSSHSSTLLYFYFPSQPSSLILLKSAFHLFSFLASVCSELPAHFLCLILSGYHVAFVPNSLSFSDNFCGRVCARPPLWQMPLLPSVAAAWPKRDLDLPPLRKILPVQLLLKTLCTVTLPHATPVVLIK